MSDGNSSEKSWAAEYEALGRLGSGSYGTVLKVRQKDDGTQYALKEIHSANPDDLERLRREIAALQQVDSDHVVPIVNCGRTLDWYVMPLADTTLTDKAPTMDRGERASAIWDIVQGLRAVHEANILHRDISPSNVLYFEEERRWKVSDFGLAKQLRIPPTHVLTTSSQGRIGNERYGSPEAAVNSIYITIQSDIFSLGQLIGWLVSGRLPSSGQPTVLPESNPWRELVLHMTRVPTAERPRNLREVHEKVAEIRTKLNESLRQSWSHGAAWAEDGAGVSTSARERAARALMKYLHANESLHWNWRHDEVAPQMGLTVHGVREGRTYCQEKGWIERTDDDRDGNVMRLTAQGHAEMRHILTDEDLFASKEAPDAPEPLGEGSDIPF